MSEKRLYSVEDYYKMAEFGIIKPNEKLELIHGEIIIKPKQTPKHASYKTRINRILVSLDIHAIVRCSNPLRFDKWNEPEPDLAVLKFRDDFYTENHPTEKDTFFVIEIADVTLGFDQIIKTKLYAAANISEYWIFNLIDNQLEIYENPIDGKYTTKTILKRGDKVVIPHFNIEIDVSEIIK